MLENSVDTPIDTLVEFGTTFDWISPLICFVHDWQERPTVGFVVHESDGNEFTLRPLLRTRGYRSWGWMLVRHNGQRYTTWRTRKKQAWLTHRLLTNAYVPHTCSEFILLPFPRPVILSKLSNP